MSMRCLFYVFFLSIFFFLLKKSIIRLHIIFMLNIKAVQATRRPEKTNQSNQNRLVKAEYDTSSGP